MDPGVAHYETRVEKTHQRKKIKCNTTFFLPINVLKILILIGPTKIEKRKENCKKCQM